MGQEHRRDPDVIVDHLSFGERDLRIKYLVQVRDGKLFPFDNELGCFRHFFSSTDYADFRRSKRNRNFLCQNLCESVKSADLAKNLSGDSMGCGLQMRATQCSQLSWPLRISISARMK